MGDALLQADCSTHLVFDGASRRAMRQILRHYGLDWPPLTLGEFYGLLDYCDRLDALSGSVVLTPDQAEQWLGLSAALQRSCAPPRQLALTLYAAGDAEALCTFHREQGTMAALGREYSLFAESLAAHSR